MPDPSGWTCRYCGVTGKIRLERRPKVIAKPLGTYSLSGTTYKISAQMIDWPYAICDACGHESEGKPADEGE